MLIVPLSKDTTISQIRPKATKASPRKVDTRYSLFKFSFVHRIKMLHRRLKLRFARPLRAVRHALPPVNFITLHYAYFILTGLLAAVIFWASSTTTHVSFTDSLFLCVSAMTEA